MLPETFIDYLILWLTESCFTLYGSNNFIRDFTKYTIEKYIWIICYEVINLLW